MPKLSDYIRATIALGGATDPTVTEGEAMAVAERIAERREVYGCDGDWCSTYPFCTHEPKRAG